MNFCALQVFKVGGMDWGTEETAASYEKYVGHSLEEGDLILEVNGRRGF